MAVAAMDFTIPFMWTELTRSMSQCQNSGTRCVVIDNAGFVVIHPDFVDPRLASENGVANKHITEMVAEGFIFREKDVCNLLF